MQGSNVVDDGRWWEREYEARSGLSVREGSFSSSIKSQGKRAHNLSNCRQYCGTKTECDNEKL